MIQKRILICASAATGGDWPPMAALVVGLHHAGYAMRCFGDGGVARALAAVPLPVEVIVSEQTPLDAIRQWRAAGMGGPSPLQTWTDTCLPAVRALVSAFEPQLVLSQLFTMALARRLKATCQTPWGLVNPAYYFGPDARRPFEADYAGPARYFFRQFQTLIEDADLVLHGTDEGFDPPPPSLPRHHHYVGPLLWEAAGQVPAFLDEPGAPWVLGTLSSVPQPEEIALARAVLTALAEEPVRVVVTLPDTHPRDALGAIPAHIRLTPYVPHAAVLTRSCLMVGHGGHGIVSKALYHGVPMVLIPWDRDQPGVAARAATLGVAEVVPRPALTAGRLRVAIRRVLDTPSYREQAQRVAQRLQARHAVAEACGRIAAFLNAV